MSSGSSRLKVLIVSPPYRLSAVCLPLGLAYIAAVVRKAGYPVEVIDMDVKNHSPEEFKRILQEKHFDVLCLGGMITAWNFFKFTCDHVKRIKPGVKVVIGGGVITSTPRSFLSVSPADVGVIGEGEDKVLELLSAFEQGRPLSEIHGIVYREGDQIQQTPPGALIEDLDRIPFPAWDLFDVANSYARYPSHNSLIKARRQMAIATSRGCPYQCTFCYTEKKVRYRSVENVLAEMEELKNRYGVTHFSLVDDLFVAQKKRVVHFCEELIRRKMNVSWNAAGRCNLADYELYKLMRSAGCYELGLGIESGSAAILDSIKKKQTPEQVIHAVKTVQKAGIVPGGTFILGLPAETPETVRETVEVYKTINSYRSLLNQFFFATPYPGTELYETVKKKGRIPDEIAFFEMLSQKGDAVDFVINCTDAFTDKELVVTKAAVEKEVFADFMKKHPLFAFSRWLARETPWGKLKVLLLRIKMRGLIEMLQFLWIKLKVKQGKIPDPFVRHWAKIHSSI
ncbi:MAG: radical SAM protein [Candidatus Omnitrophota bacterium]